MTQPTPPSTYLAVCVSDFIHADTVTDMVTMFTVSPCTAFFFRGSQVPEQRNQAVMAFLETTHTHLLFIDSDMRFPATTLQRLLSHNVGVVACDYRKRITPHDPVTTYKPNSKFAGLLQVESVATGCMLIRRDIIDQMSQPYFTYPFDISTNKHVTEDTYFCSKCHEKQIPVYIDCELSREIGHISSIVLKL